jgi:hypothetical protein
VVVTRRPHRAVTTIEELKQTRPLDGTRGRGSGPEERLQRRVPRVCHHPLSGCPVAVETCHSEPPPRGILAQPTAAGRPLSAQAPSPVRAAYGFPHLLPARNKTRRCP